MVFRKPYALLIKNFKLIHGILLFLMIIFFINLNNTYVFLKTYVDQAIYQQIIDAISLYFSMSVFLLYILIVAIFMAILVLLGNKKKPTKAYMAATIFYIAMIFPIVISLVALNAIQMNSISIQLIRITTDLMMIAVYLQIPFMLLVLSRVVGFNVKQFNFQKDLNELAIEEADSAEFEVGVELDAEDFRTKINRQVRMIRYVLIENRILVIIAAIILVLALSISSYVYFGIVKKIYHENENFRTSGLIIKVVDTHQMRMSSSGEELFKKDFLVAVTMRFKNRSQYEVKLPAESIFLRTGAMTKYEPYTKHRYELAELGKRYSKNKTIKPGETIEYVFSYKVANEFWPVNKGLEYFDKVENKGGQNISKYIKVQLNSKEYKVGKIDSSKKMGENLSLAGSLLKNSSFKATSFEIAERYYPEYTELDPYTKESKIYNTIVSPSNTSINEKLVARVKVKIKTDETIDPNATKSFFERYGRLVYTINSKEYKHKEALYNIEPSNNDDYVYFEVMSDVREADKIYVDFVIRDKTYRYHLLDKTSKNNTKENNDKR